MRSLTRRLLTVVLLSLSLAACDKLFNKTAAVTSDDMTLGDPNAKVTVIEYASATCPHCARFNNDVFPAFKAKYIDTGKIRYVFREFLTPPPEVAAAAFLTARCAGKDKYFSVLDAVFHDQQQIVAGGDPRGTLEKIAEGAGLTDQQFDACVSNDDALKAINDRVDTYVKRDGVNATPTFIINGKRLEGEQSLASLDAAIAAAQAAAH